MKFMLMQKNSNNTKKILQMIHTEKNNEKREMLHSVLNHNLNIARERDELLRLGNIIDAMKVIDRKFFALAGKDVYSDSPLSIGHEQTISQPRTVARMLMLAKVEKGMDVLEIGAGSGWNAALTSKLVDPAKVTSVERISPLAKFAENNFKGFIKSYPKKLNCEFVFADALDKKSKIWSKKYDRIIVTAGADNELSKKIQEMASELLKENGLLVYPTREHGSEGALELWKKKNNRLARLAREAGYVFVPLLEGEEK